MDDLIHDIETQEMIQEKNREPTMFEQLSQMLTSSIQTQDKEGLSELTKDEIDSGLTTDDNQQKEEVRGGSFF